MRFCTTSIAIRTGKVNSSVEMQTSILVNINIQRLEISRCIQDSDISSLDKVIGDDDVFLIWGNLDVVRTDGWLSFVGVVETLDVVKVRDVEGSDMVCSCEGKVSEFAVFGDVGARD